MVIIMTFSPVIGGKNDNCYSCEDKLDTTLPTSLFHLFHWTGRKTSGEVSSKNSRSQCQWGAGGENTFLLLKSHLIIPGSLIGFRPWGWKPILEEAERMQSLPFCWGEDHFSNLFLCQIYIRQILYFYYIYIYTSAEVKTIFEI